MSSNYQDSGNPAAVHGGLDAAAHKLSIVYRSISELKPDPKNPRSHSQKQVQQVADSIGQFGFVAPILADADGNVIAGHCRLLAARQLGMRDVPAVRLEHLTPAQVRAYQIADNKLTENGNWDDRLLAEAFKQLSTEDLDFSLDITGFELPEIDLHLHSLEAVGPEQDDPADEVPETKAVAVSKLGQLWQLGGHRLLCGSALDQSVYKTILDDELADFIFCDPPYNVPIRGHVSGNGAVRHREFAMASGEMSRVEFTNFLRAAFTQLVAYSKPGSVHDICMDWRHLVEVLAAGEATYSELLNLCVWSKRNAGMGSLYRSQHELVLVFKNGVAPHLNNIQLGKFGRNRSNLWSYPGVRNFGRGTEEGNLLSMHPTVKPVALVADAILDCSKRGDIVLDAFLGSGSTLMACERIGRSCRGIEIDPLYVDTAIRRWQRYTGDQAVNAATGRTFADHEAEVANV
jgi:16S rRNA G966 N2-methylase RsmD